MSAVSKKLISDSNAAFTTSSVAAASIRHPKLLHPSPATLTSSDPILRFSISRPPPPPLLGLSLYTPHRRTYVPPTLVRSRNPFPLSRYLYNTAARCGGEILSSFQQHHCALLAGSARGP